MQELQYCTDDRVVAAFSAVQEGHVTIEHVHGVESFMRAVRQDGLESPATFGEFTEAEAVYHLAIAATLLQLL